MNIAAKFLSCYELGGVAEVAISAVIEKYDISSIPNPNKLELSEEWVKYSTEIILKYVQERTETYDFTAVDGGRISPIIAEIEKELQGRTAKERERYIFSLLTKFSMLADILHPTSEIDRLQSDIEDIKKDREMWAGLYKDNVPGAKEQVKACNSLIKRREKDIERLNYIQERFLEVMNQRHEPGTIEYYCNMWVRAAMTYANRLDALLLTYGIDLLQLQVISGIYLKEYRSIAEIWYYIGSFELAEYYIAALPKYAEEEQASQQPATERKLPSELNTEQARKYFRLAIEAGLMSEKYEWRASRVLLACFCREISQHLNIGKGRNYDGQKRIRWKPFEELFCVKRGALRMAISEIQKTGRDPIDIEKIDDIFKE